ncbi:Adenosine kinase [Aphelenchoides besseyi]|nr:Adenosine kinase [Aphelenchoides besseyi]KAI6200283.1 Adenosine kinase [Aphelenchoides besseyi]
MASGDPIPEGVIIGMCNPLLDIEADVGLEILEKYGMKQNDAILAEEKHLPLFKEIIQNYHVNYTPGGANQNVLRVFQWIIGQPNRSIFFGGVGNDEYGKILRDKATEAGVNVQYQVNETVKTGTCAALIYKHHRSLCADLAAANTFTIDHLLKPENQNLIKNAKFYSVSGFFITVCPDGILHVAEHAAAENKLFSLNLSAPFVSLAFTDRLDKILPYVDLLFANEQEVAAYAQAHNWDTKDVEDIGKRLAALDKVNKQRSRIVIVTQGPDPVIVIKDGKADQYPVPSIDPSKILDTTGAGDAFCGGFFAQLIRDKPIADCIKCGNWAASVIIGNPGCTFPSDLKYVE